MREEWRPAPGYEGLYSVSNLGRVRRDAPGKRAKPGLIRTTNVRRNGYARITLSKDDVPRAHAIHRLVAIAFVEGRTEDRWQVNHKNGVKHDNRAENLEWVSPSQNAHHAFQAGLHVRRNVNGSRRKLTAADVRYARRAYREKCREFGAVALARRFGVTPTTMLAAINGRTWKHVS